MMLAVTLARGAQPPPAWVAPPEVSSTAGPFNVRFLPRYPTLASASVVRDQDLAAFTGDLSRLDPGARVEAAEALRERLDAVRYWEAHFESAVADPSISSARRLDANEQRQVLLLEAATLELQLGMLGESRAVSDDDRVAFGHRLVIGPDDHVRSAVVIGGDLLVEGQVREDAVAVMGDIFVSPGARVDGSAVVVGGDVRVQPGGRVARRDLPDDDRPRDALHGMSSRFVSFLTFAGLGALTVGLFPAQVGRIAAFVERRPTGSLVVGLVGAPALLLLSALLAITIIGLPIALGVLVLVGASALLGVVGVCQALGDRLPMTVPHGRWLSLAGAAGALSCLPLLPVPLMLVTIAASITGMGAAIGSRLGSRLGSRPGQGT